MTSFPHRIAAVTMALAAGVCGSALAQAPTPPPAPPAAAPVSAAPGPAPAPPAAATPANPAVEQRIQALQSQLGITPAQAPLWTAFAQAMRDNAATTEQLFEQRASNTATMTAVDNMHSYAALARTYADDTATLSTAFDSLYASLSQTQKQAADTLFRQQASATNKPRR